MTTNYFKHPLDYSYERVRRAREHLIDLNVEISRTFQRQEDAAIAYFDPNPPYPLCAKLPPETFGDMRVGVLVGEICYNLRAALDYLVFQLARFDSGIEQKGTQFPIEDTPKGFRHRQKRGWLNGINPRHVAAIEGLQPYKGCDWTATLRDFSNPDKHQKLVGITGHLGITAHDSRNNPRFGTTLGMVRRTPHPIDGEVEVKLFFAHAVQFSDGTPIMETLEELCSQVSETLNAFKPEF